MSRENNFNLIRMVGASAVIVSHSFPVAMGQGAPEPLTVLDFNLGRDAVQVFFAISGYLVTRSFDHRPLPDYCLLRIGRIAPGFALVSLFGLFVTMIVGSEFAKNPYPNVLNGPLWTLAFEILCYFAVIVSRRFNMFLAVFAVFYLATASTMFTDFADLGLPFVIGMCIYRFRVPLSALAAIALLLLALIVETRPLWTLALGYGALWFAQSVKIPFYRADYSYGTYIFGWPIQQLIVLRHPGISPVPLMALALPITWAVAAASWHLVESPGLNSVRRYIDRRHGDGDGSAAQSRTSLLGRDNDDSAEVSPSRG